MRYSVFLFLSLFIATGFANNWTLVPYIPSATVVVNSTSNSIHTTSIPTTSLPSSYAPNSFTVIPLSSSFLPSSPIMPTLTPVTLPNNTCYSVNYTNTKPCVLLCVKQPIRLTSNFTYGNITVAIPGPKDIVSGFCPKTINRNFDRSGLNFNWSNSGINYELNLTFVLNQKVNIGKLGLQDLWYLETATFRSNMTYSVNFTDGTGTGTITSDVRRAYTCDTPRLINLTSNTTSVTIINMTEYTLQPFALNLTGNMFKFIDTCEPGGIPIFVPMIVAGILAGFVLILLLLYGFGRLRLKRKGEYEKLS